MLTLFSVPSVVYFDLLTGIDFIAFSQSGLDLMRILGIADPDAAECLDVEPPLLRIQISSITTISPKASFPVFWCLVSDTRQCHALPRRLVTGA